MELELVVEDTAVEVEDGGGLVDPREERLDRLAAADDAMGCFPAMPLA